MANSRSSGYRGTRELPEWVMGPKSWILTVTTKRIALLYVISITFFSSFIGALRADHPPGVATPRGDLVQSIPTNKLFTMHVQGHGHSSSSSMPPCPPARTLSHPILIWQGLAFPAHQLLKLVNFHIRGLGMVSRS